MCESCDYEYICAKFFFALGRDKQSFHRKDSLTPGLLRMKMMMLFSPTLATRDEWNVGQRVPAVQGQMLRRLLHNGADEHVAGLVLATIRHGQVGADSGRHPVGAPFNIRRSFIPHRTCNQVKVASKQLFVVVSLPHQMQSEAQSWAFIEGLLFFASAVHINHALGRDRLILTVFICIRLVQGLKSRQRL